MIEKLPYDKTSAESMTYDFLSKELTYHPELPQFSAEDLAARKDDRDFWQQLSEHLDCFRICDNCGRPMIEGYCVDDCDTYCSEVCMHEQYKEDVCKKLFDEGTAYYTVWYEDSISYNKE